MAFAAGAYTGPMNAIKATSSTPPCKHWMYDQSKGAAMIRAILSFFTGEVLDCVLATVDRKIVAETGREALKPIAMNMVKSVSNFCQDAENK